ncbi:MAG TPA: hypothetical protein VL651_15760 [Bacteroidia bacterium]|jgi:hypothetical protein|nr:hypothetical protein [Bacteroidia bacterium]
MEFRNSNYAFIDSVETELIETSEGKLKLIYRGISAPNETFSPSTKHKGIFVRYVTKEEIDSGFQASTFALFKDFIFQVDRFRNGKYRLTTSDDNAYKALGLNMVDRGWYDIEVPREEIQKMWEERKPSGYGFPFPEGMKEVEEIEF